MTKFVFVAPDGSRLVRTSKTRAYTHAVLYKRDGKWRIGSCAGKIDLGIDRLREWLKSGHEAVLVEVQK